MNINNLPISVVIIANNEQDNIQKCIESVLWSDDIILIDSGSTDNTILIAKKFGVKVFHNDFVDYADQRNFAIKNCAIKNLFTLYLDADEVVTSELKNELMFIAKSAKTYKAYKIPFKLIWREKWLKYSGMYPAYQVRFGLTNELKFKMVGHGQREDIDASHVGLLKGPIEHYNFSKGVINWISRHCNYAKLESTNMDNYSYKSSDLLCNSTMRRRWLKKIAYNLPCRPLLKFIYVYIFRLGFLDGNSGLKYAILLAFYEFMIDLNSEEINANINNINS